MATADLGATADRIPAVGTAAAATRRRHRTARAPTEATTEAPAATLVTTAALDTTAAPAEARVPTEADAEPDLGLGHPWLEEWFR